MQILGYGEDSLTLWALKRELGTILRSLCDTSRPENCKVLYRPSFGRGHGFGEFDFIILADACVYLGESKWQRQPGETN